MYIGRVTFSNLGSQDVTPSGKKAQDGCSQGERTSSQDSGGPSTLPLSTVVIEPCSPRSVYCLANKVCLAPFRKDVVTYGSFT